MERLEILLKRAARRRRQELAQFLESVSLFLDAGFDLSYAWPEAFRSLGARLDPWLAGLLEVPHGETPSATLRRLARNYPEPSHRIWFLVLQELYESGAPLREAMRASAQALRAEHARDLEAHCRTLPTRANVILLLFFLPPTLALLFLPLLSEMTRAFSH